MISLDSYSREVVIIWTPFWFISVFELTAYLKFVKLQYVSPGFLVYILVYISLWNDCLFEICKIAVCFLWLSMPVHYKVTDEALLAKTT